MTPEQTQFYQEQGYLVVPGLFGLEELAVWLERFEAIVNGDVEPAERMLVMRDVMVAKGAVEAGSQSACPQAHTSSRSAPAAASRKATTQALVHSSRREGEVWLARVSLITWKGTGSVAPLCGSYTPTRSSRSQLAHSSP